MVFIINSDDFKIDSTCISAQILGSKVKLKGFRTFYTEDGKYINPINHLVNVHRLDRKKLVLLYERRGSQARANLYSLVESPKRTT